MVKTMTVFWAFCEVFVCLRSEMCLVEQFRKVNVFVWYFSSKINGTQYVNWSVFLSVKCPSSQKFLSNCLQRSTVSTSTSVPTSWCFYFLPVCKLWKWGRAEGEIFWIFCSSSPLCQLAPPLWLWTFHPIHTNAKKSVTIRKVWMMRKFRKS